MNAIRALFLCSRNFFHKDRLDRELHDELAIHLELHIADNLRAGMTPPGACRDAFLSGSNESSRYSVELLGHCYRIPI